jgi:hypothetical protein
LDLDHQYSWRPHKYICFHRNQIHFTSDSGSHFKLKGFYRLYFRSSVLGRESEYFQSNSNLDFYYHIFFCGYFHCGCSQFL